MIISELRKLPAGQADVGVAHWAATHPLVRCYLSAITIKELEYAVLLVERRDPHQGQRLRQWLDGVYADFAERVLPVSGTIARRAASLHVPDPAPEADAYIAATALTHDLSLITRNVAHFARFPALTVINPWGDAVASR